MEEDLKFNYINIRRTKGVFRRFVNADASIQLTLRPNERKGHKRWI